MPKRRRKRSSSVEKVLPLVYFAMAVASAIALLPSALRPPTQQPNQSAELAPNAPPDKNQAAIIGSLQRATSGVAARANPNGSAPATPTTAPLPQPQQAPTVTVPRACPHGFGTPPRQVESVYAPPCAEPWSGNNGGATSKGVTADEINISAGSSGGGGGCDQSGRVDDLVASGDVNGVVRTFYVLERYFNQNFQFYGRRISFFCVEPASLEIPDLVAAGVKADEQYHIFASGWVLSNTCDEETRRKIICFTPLLDASMYQSRAPYMWSGEWEGGEDVVRFAAEYICKKLSGHDAVFAGDATYHDKPRKFAALSWGGRRLYGQNGPELQALVKQQCGEDLPITYYEPWGDDANGQATLATVAVKFRNEGVTTVIAGPASDSISFSQFTNAAASQNYYPEWYVCDCGDLDWNSAGRLLNQNEWAHAFGVSGFSPELPNANTECYRAYHTIDPAHDPDYTNCHSQWVDLMMIMSGIQMAGPNLTPLTFEQGLFRLGMRYYLEPKWAQGGGYAPGVFTYSHNANLIYWDPSAVDPQDSASLGAYRYINDGRRFCHGQLDGDTSHLFKDGVLLPSGWADHATQAPVSDCPPP